jgi:hypothetical protein
MPFNPNPAAPGLHLHLGDPNLIADYAAARYGQWFTGVVNSVDGAVYLLPADAHALQTAVNNSIPRAMNQYASKPDYSKTYPPSLRPAAAARPNAAAYAAVGLTPPVGHPFAGWQTFAYLGLSPNLDGVGPHLNIPDPRLLHRQSAHDMVIGLYGLQPGDCEGFRIIKTTDAIATMNDHSNTLNSHGGPANAPDPSRPGVDPYTYGVSTSGRMNAAWSAAVCAFLPTAGLGIQTVQLSN